MPASRPQGAPSHGTIYGNARSRRRKYGPLGGTGSYLSYSSFRGISRCHAGHPGAASREGL
eukprot:365570-Chlamydomonas_euryale.AAC.5